MGCTRSKPPSGGRGLAFSYDQRPPRSSLSARRLTGRAAKVACGRDWLRTRSPHIGTWTKNNKPDALFAQAAPVACNISNSTFPSADYCYGLSDARTEIPRGLKAFFTDKALFLSFRAISYGPERRYSSIMRLFGSLTDLRAVIHAQNPTFLPKTSK
ncbi:hypothetical protein SAMN03159358_2885 [Paenibacillus sp. NFR01]|nr:hypothetical protein SAMN03159358_2885 [Paenibacillus sp. NFR01]